MFPTPPRHKELKGKEKRSRIQEEVRAAVEEGRTSREAGMGQQGAWTRWEQVMDRKVTWTELWQSEPHETRNTRGPQVTSLMMCSGASEDVFQEIVKHCIFVQ